MNETPASPEKPTEEPTAHGGVDIHGGDVRAGHDIVAGDVNIAGDSISGQSVQVQQGFSASQVQRLVLIVGGLVFATAAFFFILGAIAAGAVVSALNSPLQSSQSAAADMQQKIQVLNSLSPGQRFQVTFSENELSSYFRFVLGPRIGISDGKARLMDVPGKIALGGTLDGAGGLPFIAELSATTAETPLAVTGAWVKILPTPEGTSFGWVPVTPFAQNLTRQLNDLLFGRVQFTFIDQISGGAAGPDSRNRLIVQGVAK